MKTKIALIGKGVNLSGWDQVLELLSGRGYSWKIISKKEEIDKSFDLGLLIGCYELIPEKILNLPRCGTVLFHSSDLPKGRGWAPIYYTIINKDKFLVQTLLFASKKIDAGKIIAKAAARLEGNEIESEVREIDDILTLRLIENTLDDLLREKIFGVEQKESEAIHYNKRSPEDSRIDPDQSIYSLFDKMRALPNEHPAFFKHRGRVYTLSLDVADRCNADDVEIKIVKFY